MTKANHETAMDELNMMELADGLIDIAGLLYSPETMNDLSASIRLLKHVAERLEHLEKERQHARRTVHPPRQHA